MDKIALVTSFLTNIFVLFGTCITIKTQKKINSSNNELRRDIEIKLSDQNKWISEVREAKSEFLNVLLRGRNEPFLSSEAIIKNGEKLRSYFNYKGSFQEKKITAIIKTNDEKTYFLDLNTQCKLYQSDTNDGKNIFINKLIGEIIDTVNLIYKEFYQDMKIKDVRENIIDEVNNLLNESVDISLKIEEFCEQYPVNCNGEFLDNKIDIYEKDYNGRQKVIDIKLNELGKKLKKIDEIDNFFSFSFEKVDSIINTYLTVEKELIINKSKITIQ